MSLNNQFDASDNKDTARETAQGNENRLETSAGGPLTDLTARERDTLRTVAELSKETNAGVDIKQRLEEVHGRAFHSSAVYRTLMELRAENLIEKSRSLEDGRESCYKLTEKGRNKLAAHGRWMGARAGPRPSPNGDEADRPAPETSLSFAERAGAAHAILNEPESRKAAQDAGYGHEWARAESACYRLLSEIEQGLGGEER